MFRQRLALLSLVWIASFCPAQAQIEPLDQKFKNQQTDREKTLEMCKKQYAGAAYLYSREKSDKGALAPSPVFGDGVDTDGFRFMVTSRGVQGISPSVVQQSSGKWKCERGSIESPMALGKEYSKTRPLYTQTSSPPGCRPFVILPPYPGRPLVPFDPFARPCSKRLTGYETSRRMVKDEECRNGLRCLVLYRNTNGGKTSRDVIGVSVGSLERLFPYSEDPILVDTLVDARLNAWGGYYDIRLGPASLDCRSYLGRSLGVDETGVYDWKNKKNTKSSFRERYLSCLQYKMIQLFES